MFFLKEVKDLSWNSQWQKSDYPLEKFEKKKKKKSDVEWTTLMGNRGPLTRELLLRFWQIMLKSHSLVFGRTANREQSLHVGLLRVFQLRPTEDAEIVAL